MGLCYWQLLIGMLNEMSIRKLKYLAEIGLSISSFERIGFITTHKLEKLHLDHPCNLLLL